MCCVLTARTSSTTRSADIWRVLPWKNSQTLQKLQR